MPTLSVSDVYPILTQCVERSYGKWPWLRRLYDRTDVLHEVVVQLMERRALEKYDSSRPLQHYLYSIVRNWVKDRWDSHSSIRRGGGKTVVSLGVIYNTSTEPLICVDLETPILVQELFEQVEEDADRDLLHSYVENSMPQTAVDLGSTESKVKTRLHKVFRKIRKRVPDTANIY